MTREDIMRLAKEAGLASVDVVMTLDELERFAGLIREACAEICDWVEDELQYDDQVSAAGGAWRCGFEIRERGKHD